MSELLAAVDVGTGSARAGIFTVQGKLLGRAEHPIALNQPTADHFEQDSEDIWRAVTRAVRLALASSGAAPEDVVGISFDATCSLVARAADGGQVSVSTVGEDRWDTIVWMDHRARVEAQECTDWGEGALDAADSVMSPELQIPKLMWLKRRMPQSWARMGLAFDLADFLTWKACGSLERSRCTLVCKWSCVSEDAGGWPEGFLAAMGLTDLPENSGVSERGCRVGTFIGGLTPVAAQALGLSTRCRVATGLVDAHAGALGALGAYATEPGGLDRRAALIAGTSTCVMSFSTQPVRIEGMWGPFWNVALADLWMIEGGQSVSGGLLDHVCRTWNRGLPPDTGQHARILRRITELRAASGADFGRRLHVLPDFHGCRSPVSDPDALGVMSGLRLDGSFDELCRIYWRTAVGIALGVRQILDAFAAHGVEIGTLHMVGGHARDPILVQLYADATGRRIHLSEAPDAVLLGVAMAAAVGAGVYPDLGAAARAMGQAGVERAPEAAAVAGYARDYEVFLAMQRHRREIDNLERRP